jgi:hypothetical protein
MNPSIHNIGLDSDTYKFTLSGLNVSLANALRRTILSDIPVNAIYTQTYEDNECNIVINTTRLHMKASGIIWQHLERRRIFQEDGTWCSNRFLQSLGQIGFTKHLKLMIT